ncbi:MAG: sulfatase-like hydrolase/transferase [Bacteroidia bacterium]|nr:sulfatase-like hydrolase/transferase [Bacteroidia bacterium]
MRNIRILQKIALSIIKKTTPIFGGGVMLFSQPAAAQTQAEQPNILIIMTDQQAWDAVGYAGNKMIKTPNLDRFASQGVNFSHAVTPCPVSCPARTSILTGRLTETTTIRDNNDVNVNDCYYPTFDEILVKRGYIAECHGKFHSPEHMAAVYSNPAVYGVSGKELIVKWEPLYKKYLNQNLTKRPLKPGELYESTFYGGIIPYKPDPIDRRYKYLPSGEIPEESLNFKKLGQDDVHGVLDLPAEYTITAVQGRETIDAIDRLKDNKFVITCSFHCPHVPITPSEPYASLYKADNMITPVSIRDDRSNSPYKPNPLELPYTDPENIKYMTANYYAFVSEIDDWVGRILNKLDELKLSEKTLVIFVSDHGEMLGAHGMRGKFCFYEESVRIPFLVRFPGKINPGQTISTPVSELNIFATKLDYAGLKNIPGDGYSLKPVMEGSPSVYDFAVSEWTWKNQNVPSLMIRTNDWKLMTTHRDGGKNIEALYDLKNDPFEMNNLLGTNPERFKYKEITESLRSKLVGYLKDVNSPLVKGVEQRILIQD